MKYLWQKIEGLGRTARTDAPPAVDVSARVMAGLSTATAPDDDRAINWVMALSAAAAAMLLAALYPLYGEWSDPVTAVVASLSWSLL